MHANTIYDHNRLTARATDLVTAWAGTDPMISESAVKTALEIDDGPTPESAALLPYVVDACRDAGLLVAPWYAAIGDDGTRPVVWGIGESEEAALEDARLAVESGDCESELTIREVTPLEATRIQNGEVDCATLWYCEAMAGTAQTPCRRYASERRIADGAEFALCQKHAKQFDRGEEHERHD